MDVSQAQRSAVIVPIVDAAQQAWWKNFWHHDPVFYIELDNLQIALAPYNCRYVNTFVNSYLEFETERDYLIFVLRWA